LYAHKDFGKSQPDAASLLKPLIGKEVTWVVAIEILKSGEIETVTQSHILVALQFKDGSTISTRDPNIDDIFSRCPPPFQSSEVGTVCSVDLL
jgi:hypothetical protein